MTPDQLALMIDDYLDGGLDAGQVQALEAYLREHPAAVTQFVASASLHRVLQEKIAVDQQASVHLFVDEAADGEDLVAADRAVMEMVVDQALEARRRHELQDQARQILAAQQAEEALERRYRLSHPEPVPVSRDIVIPMPLVLLGAAAAVLLTVWIGWTVTGSSPSAPNHTDHANQGTAPMPPAAAPATPVTHVALIRRSVDAGWQDRARDQGQYLASGEPLTLQSGLVEIVFGDGAAVIVEGPASFIPTGPESIRLVSGRVVATLSDAADGFTIATDAGEISGRVGESRSGQRTEFGAHVFTSGTTHAHVFQGQIALTPARDATSAAAPSVFELQAGDALAARRSVQPRVIEPVGQMFVRSEEFGARAEAEISPHARWLAHSYMLRRDPDVVALYTFEADDRSAGVLMNRAAGTGDALDGALGDGAEYVAPRWAQGRFGQTGALRFGHASGGRSYGVVVPDHDALDLDGDMTLAAWVRGDDLNTYIGTLITKRSAPAARLNYNFSLTNNNGMQLGSGVDDYDIACWSYAPNSGRLTVGRWQHVSVTLDSRTIRFYIDGVLTHTADRPQRPLVNDAPLLIGASMAGLELPGLDISFPFTGLISEVLIARRAFTDQEIARLYEAGQVDR